MVPVESKTSVLDSYDSEDRSSLDLLLSTAPNDDESVALTVDGIPIMNDHDSHDNRNNNNNGVEEDHAHDRMVGAGVGAGLFGTLLCGPILGILLGFGTAYATDKDGATGDAARAVGDVALVARDKARQVDNKHNLVDRAQVAANDAWDRAKELDRQHNVLDKTKSFGMYTWESIKEMNRNHRVLERSVESVGRAISWMAEKLAEKINPKDHNNQKDRSDAT